MDFWRDARLLETKTPDWTSRYWPIWVNKTHFWGRKLCPHTAGLSGNLLGSYLKGLGFIYVRGKHVDVNHTADLHCWNGHWAQFLTHDGDVKLPFAGIHHGVGYFIWHSHITLNLHHIIEPECLCKHLRCVSMVLAHFPVTTNRNLTGYFHYLNIIYIHWITAKEWSTVTSLPTDWCRF